MKMINIIIILLFILACNNNSKDSSAFQVILNTKDFTNVLKAIHLTEAKYTFQKSNNIDSLNYISDQYDSIFEAHSIKEEAFYQSMDYYLQHPKELEAIYDSILIDLKNDQSHLR